MWCPCVETVAEPEPEPEPEPKAKLEENVAVRAEKTQKHVFVSKTVRSCRAALLHVRTSRLNMNPLLPSGDLDRDVLAVRQEDPLWEDRDEVQKMPIDRSSGVQTQMCLQLLQHHTRTCSSDGNGVCQHLIMLV